MSAEASKKAITRKNIIDAAIRILSKKEYHECLIDLIAKNAGIAKGTVYLYFKSKQELYYSILSELVGEAKQIAESTTHCSGHPAEQASMLFERMNRFIISRGNAFLIAKAEAGNLTGKRRLMAADLYGGLLEQIGKIFEDGVNKKMIKKHPPVFLGALIMSSMLTAAKYKQMNRPGARTVTPELLADIFMNGIRIEK
jgi:AcrR family transcriptional regulator